MKKKLFYLIVANIIAGSMLISCAASEPALTPTPTVPSICLSLTSGMPPSDLPADELLLTMVERMNAGDIEGAMAFFDDDAQVRIFGVPPEGFEMLIGKQEICSRWVEFIEDNLVWNLEIKFKLGHSGGVKVTANSQRSLDFTREIGVAPNDFNDTYFIKDGRILNYASVLTYEALEEYRPLDPAMFPTMVTLPDASSEIPSSEIKVTFDEYICTIEAPKVWKAGDITIIGEVKGQDVLYGIAVVFIDEEYDFYDVAISSNYHAPAWANYSFYEFEAGETTHVHHVEDNIRYLLCLREPSNVDSALNVMGPFIVMP